MIGPGPGAFGRGSRRLPHAARWLLLAVGVVPACTASPEDTAYDQAVPATADRESWNVAVQVRERDLDIQILAPYVADFVEQQVTRMDSGATVTFRERQGDLRCTISAQRLTLPHADPAIDLAGAVRLAAGEDFVLEADTLRWDATAARLTVPGPLRMSTASGSETGRDLETDARVSEWSVRQVDGSWRRQDERGAYEVKVQAARAHGRRAEGYVLQYDSVAVEYRGVSATGASALLDERGGRLTFARGIRAADGDFRFAGDSAVVDLRGDRLDAWGAVSFTDSAASGGGLRLDAARAAYARGSGWLEARGDPALFTHGERTIAADSLRYERDEGRLAAIGRVLLADSLVQLQADAATYDRRAGQATASGHVVALTPRLPGRLRAGNVRYDTQPGVALLGGGAVLERAQSDSGTAALRAERMRLDVAAGRLEVEDSLRLETPDAWLRADRGGYSEADSALLLAGGARWRQVRAADAWDSSLDADSMRVVLDGGRIVRVELLGTLAGSVAARSGSRSWIQGRGGVVEVAEGRPDRFAIAAEAEVMHRDGGRGQTTHCTSRQMTLTFDADGLRQVQASGGAQMTSRLPAAETAAATAADSLGRGGARDDRQAARNQVRGEQLEITFDGDQMDVRVGPGVDGTYQPADSN